MSRFQEWTSSHRGLGNFASQHLELDVRNTKGKSDKYYGVEMKKLIDGFSKKHKVKGSFTERVLIISRRMYPEWKLYILSLKQEKPCTT